MNIYIIRYVVRLRNWRFLAKVIRVKALIINITINSVAKTVIYTPILGHQLHLVSCCFLSVFFSSSSVNSL